MDEEKPEEPAGAKYQKLMEKGGWGSKKLLSAQAEEIKEREEKKRPAKKGQKRLRPTGKATPWTVGDRQRAQQKGQRSGDPWGYEPGQVTTIGAKIKGPGEESA